ncbi:MAG TPA: hypothetical protein VNX21_03705, partial [Candidatus Thermoplasmatota archaeon]|nr:hypothetical protein [Candidatus Thermoplasmatota archaeon]
SGDLRQAAVNLGATRVPTTGPAIPTLTTPADSFVGNVAPSTYGMPSLPGPAAVALGLAAGAGVAAAGVAAARAAKKRSAKKKAAAKKSSAKKASRKASKAPAKKSKGAKAAKAKRSAKKHGGGKGRAEDAGGAIPKTWRGKQIYRAKNGSLYVMEMRKHPQSGKRVKMARFIPM